MPPPITITPLWFKARLTIGSCCRERHWSAMHSGLRDDLVAADGPLAGQTLQTVEPVSGG